MKAEGRPQGTGTPERMTWRVADHGTTSENDSQSLWWAAGIAQSRGQEVLAEIYKTRARRAEYLEEYERIRLIPLKPIKLPPIPGRWSQRQMSESFYRGSSQKNSDTRACGVLRFGRENGDRTVIYRMKCGQRTCSECRPKVIAAKVDPLPDEMFALEVEREAWPTLDRKLRRWRAAGKAGDFARIPLDSTRLLIVSDARIGNVINRETVRDFMLDAESVHGQITASKAWQPNASSPSEGFVDEGRVTSSPEWIIRRTRRLGIPPDVDAAMSMFDFGLTTNAEHADLRQAVGVETDAEFWARTTSRRPHGDTLARMTLARVA